ncbi:hypothetical protein PHMEG_00031141 [Phytophthora megakarya]|uniref:Uncharacterized protein n=1 Tax=Phytophthora megakarya TaxID=4795 RepID=A0A225UYD4_9STRA|nr:hypothetical protein PHMEG_00031141 [Phytophthora megakarya]
MQAHSELAPKRTEKQGPKRIGLPGAKSDVRKLYKLVRVKDKEQDIEERALKKANLSRHKNEKTNTKLNPKQNKRHIEQRNHCPIKKVKQEKGNDPQKKTNGQTGRVPAKGAPIDGCFHCRGAHYLSKCTTAIPAGYEKLLADHQQGKKVFLQKGGRAAELKRIKPCFPIQNRRVLLENEVEVPCCIDSGADRCCLAPKTVKPGIVRVKLDKPIKCTMADNTSVLVGWIVKLNLKLQTIAGIVHIADPVKCLIIPGDPGTFLLGNGLLIMLGIDVERQVGLLAVGATDVNDDEFDKVDGPTVTNRTVHDDEVRNSVFEMVEKAIKNGFPREYQNELTRIALKFDLWRNDLGAAREQEYRR